MWNKVLFPAPVSPLRTVNPLRGLNMTLNTRIYFEGDDLNTDPLLSKVKNSRNDISSLVAKKIDENIYLFDIFLQGDKETIFLDIWNFK